jgi:hypothetical protein
VGASGVVDVVGREFRMLAKLTFCQEIEGLNTELKFRSTMLELALGSSATSVENKFLRAVTTKDRANCKLEWGRAGVQSLKR